jgi:hypothetical protein
MCELGAMSFHPIYHYDVNPSPEFVDILYKKHQNSLD